jgi:hypothetical protein
MKNRILLLIIFFPFLFSIIEVIWFFNNYNKYSLLIFSDSLFIFILSGICIGFFVALIALYRYINSNDLEIIKPKNIENIIKEIYRYEQLLDPPNVNN